MIILWNTRYLNRAIASMREIENVPNHLLAHLSPLGWEHVNLTGDYIWVPADQRKTMTDSDRSGVPLMPLLAAWVPDLSAYAYQRSVSLVLAI